MSDVQSAVVRIIFSLQSWFEETPEDSRVMINYRKPVTVVFFCHNSHCLSYVQSLASSSLSKMIVPHCTQSCYISDITVSQVSVANNNAWMWWDL